MSEFMHWIAMGGYAAYVWPAYGLVCGVLVLNVLSTKRLTRRTHTKLKQWYKHQ